MREIPAMGHGHRILRKRKGREFATYILESPPPTNPLKKSVTRSILFHFHDAEIPRTFTVCLFATSRYCSRSSEYPGPRPEFGPFFRTEALKADDNITAGTTGTDTSAADSAAAEITPKKEKVYPPWPTLFDEGLKVIEESCLETGTHLDTDIASISTPAAIKENSRYTQKIWKHRRKRFSITPIVYRRAAENIRPWWLMLKVHNLRLLRLETGHSGLSRRSGINITGMIKGL